MRQHLPRPLVFFSVLIGGLLLFDVLSENSIILYYTKSAGGWPPHRNQLYSMDPDAMEWFDKQRSFRPVDVHNVSLDDGRTGYHGVTLVWRHSPSKAPDADEAFKTSEEQAAALASHPGPISWRLEAPLRTSAHEIVERYLQSSEAAAGQGRHFTRDTLSRVLANELRATAVATLEEFDVAENKRRAQATARAGSGKRPASTSVSKLAFELDEAGKFYVKKCGFHGFLFGVSLSWSAIWPCFYHHDSSFTS